MNNINMDNSWNPNFYDEKHSYVSKYGEDLINLLEPKSGEYICDIGCGTGDLTNEISKYTINVIGVDNSLEMITTAKSKYSNIDFQLQDIKRLNFKNKFDSIFSNATLHWVKEPEQSLSFFNLEYLKT